MRNELANVIHDANCTYLNCVRVEGDAESARYLAQADAVVAHLTSDITDAEIVDALTEWQGWKQSPIVAPITAKQAEGVTPVIRRLLAQQAVTKDAENERLRGEVKALDACNDKNLAAALRLEAERDAALAEIETLKLGIVSNETDPR